MRRFWLGVLATLLAGAVGVLAFLALGLMPVSADAKPGAVETWLAGFARDAAIERAAPKRESLIDPSEELGVIRPAIRSEPTKTASQRRWHEPSDD
jgi:hypothetical protein